VAPDSNLLRGQTTSSPGDPLPFRRRPVRKRRFERGTRMQQPTKEPASRSNTHRLLAYVADLELEVDRLRKQSQFVQHETRATLRRILRLCGAAAGAADAAPQLAEVAAAAHGLDEALRDLHEPAGYHPAHDQVVPLAVR